MSAWEDLVTTALLGTERRAVPDALPEVVGRLAAAQPDTGLAVLDAAAGYVAYLQAGAQAASCPEPPPAPRQDINLAPQAAQVLLSRLLKARDVALVDEWLTTCTTHGLGVRAGLWTALATAAAAPKHPDRALVGVALGQRGRAFLALNPRWRVVVREVDAAPATPTVAPGPVWSEELTAQALASVRVTRSLGRRRITVSPPNASDKETAAQRLRAAVGGADLDAWRRHTGLAPSALLDLVRTGAVDWQADLVTGWADATRAQRHPAWTAALLRAVDNPTGLLASFPGPWDDALAEAALGHLTSARLDARTSRGFALVVAHRAPLSVHRQLTPYPEAEEVLALRIEIATSFGPPPHQETP